METADHKSDKGSEKDDLEENQQDIITNANCDLKWRFYENEFPVEGEVVMGKILRVENQTGAYVSLLEYNCIEALIMASEYSRKRTKSVQRLIKVGKREPLLVTNVDQEKGFVDLSRKRVNPEDIKKWERRYNLHLKIHNIMKQTAAELEEDLINLYKRVAWPLGKMSTTEDNIAGSQTQKIYEAFMISLQDPVQAFSKIDIDDKTKELLIANISKRMKEVSLKICWTFEVTCYQFEGIDAIKSSLKDSLIAMEDKKNDMDLSIRLIKSPLYECSTHTSKIDQGVTLLKELLKHVEKNITDRKGKFKQINEPIAIGAKEEDDIEKMMKEEEQKNEQENNENGEEDNDEGMNVDIEGYNDDESVEKKTEDTDESLKDQNGDNSGEEP